MEGGLLRIFGHGQHGHAARSAFLKRYDAMVEAIDRVAGIAVVILMAILTTVIVIQVVLRYAFNSSLDWGVEVPRVCFITLVFLAIPLAFKRGMHVGVDLVVRQAPVRLQRLFLRLCAVIMVLLLAAVTYNAARLAGNTWDQRMTTLNLSTGIFYIVLIVSSCHSVLHLFRVAFTGTAATPEALTE